MASNGTITVDVNVNLPGIEEAIGTITDKLSSVADIVEASGINQMFSSIADTINSIGGVIDIFSGKIASLDPEGLQGITNAIGGIQSVSGVFTSLSEGMGSFVGFTEDLKTIGPAISGIGPAFSAIGGAVKGLIPMLSGMMAPLMGILPIVLIVLALVAAFVYLFNTNEQFRTSVMALIDNLANALMPIFTTLITILGMIIEAIAPVIKQIAEALIPVFEKIMPVVSAIAQLIGTVITTIMEKITPIIEFIVGIITKIVKAITEKVGPIADWIGEKVMLIVEKIKPIIAKVKEIFGKVKEIVGGVFDGIKTAWGGLTGFVGGVIDGVKSAFSNLVDNVKKAVNFVTGGINKAIDIINKIPGPNIPHIPQLYNGTNNFIGGFAYMNEGGRGELTYLPNGAQVIPHDVSMQYAREAARISSGDSSASFDYDAMAKAVYGISGALKAGMIEAVDGMGVSVNNREFGRIVRSYGV